MWRYALIEAPFGRVGLLAGPAGLVRVLLASGTPSAAAARLRRLRPEAVPDPELLPDLQGRIREYLAGRPQPLEAPLDRSGLTPFQQVVLDACAKIPHGQVMTYGELARAIGRPGAARAIGRALALNPFPLVIPCHRVVARDGSLTGFSADHGIRLKRWLIDLEAGRATTFARRERACTPG